MVASEAEWSPLLNVSLGGIATTSAAPELTAVGCVRAALPALISGAARFLDVVFLFEATFFFVTDFFLEAFFAFDVVFLLRAIELPLFQSNATGLLDR
jgi:hypothetical protein